MQKFKKNVEGILQQFMSEEVGNRFSQFAAIGLKAAIMREVQDVEKQYGMGSQKPVEKPKEPREPAKPYQDTGLTGEV